MLSSMAVAVAWKRSAALASEAGSAKPRSRSRASSPWFCIARGSTAPRSCGLRRKVTSQPV